MLSPLCGCTNVVGVFSTRTLQGPCPSCGTENFTYFGDILTIAGNKGQNTVECGNCKTKLVFDENKREVRFWFCGDSASWVVDHWLHR